jgi:hypothetical protein
MAEVLGYSPAIIELHAQGSSATFVNYIKARSDAGRA